MNGHEPGQRRSAAWRAWACAAATAAAAGVWGAEAPAGSPDHAKGSDWINERVRMEEPVKAGTPIRITNPVGNVEIRRVRDPKLPVFAIVQRKQGTPKPEFRLQRGSVLHLTVVPAPADTAPTSAPHRTACRVDLSVFVPNGSPLWIETTRGSITCKGVREQVLANSTSGLIEIFADGPVNASSKNGDIVVIYRSANRWTRDMQIASVTGNIAVRMPRPADCLVRASAGGEITSDFSTRIQQPVDSRMKAAAIRVADTAKGTRGFWSRTGRRIVHPFRRTPRLTLKTELGSVKVLRAPPGWIGSQEEGTIDDEPARQ